MIRILLIEDYPEDAGLLKRELQKQNLEFELKISDSLENMEKLLFEYKPEVILADYNLNGFSGLDALNLLKKHNLDIPFIIVSGQIGEETAVQAMKEGVHDYIMKGKLTRLGVAIERELREAKIRTQRKEQQEKLLTSGLIIKNSNDAIFITDEKGDFIDINDSFLKIFNIPKGKSGRINIADIFPPDKVNWIRDELDSKGEFRSVISFDVSDLIRHMDCNGFRLSVPDPNQDDKYVFICRDITELKQAEKSLKKSELEKSLILNSTDELFAFIGTDLKIKWVNHAFANEFNLDPENPRNIPCFHIWHNYDKPCENCAVVTSITDRVNAITEIQGKNNKTWLLKTYPVVQSGEMIGVVEVAQDITQRKIWEEEIIQAREKAEENDRLKSVFLSNMSHEIRTPLNGILGFVDFLRNKEIDESSRNHYLDIIQNSGNHLLNVINDIIEFARIEANKIEIKADPCYLHEVFLELFEMYQMSPPVVNPQLKLILDIPENQNNTRICTDEIRIRQIITNLLNNAYKFTNKGSIRFGYRFEGKKVKYFVSDTGIGIPDTFVNQIFERFRQVDESDTRSKGGTGLGLTICKNLIQLMGGEIWVESEEGKGSTFYFTHLFKEVTPANCDNYLPEEIYPALDNLNNIKILVAEDDDTNFFLLQETLEPMGAVITRAVDGLQAVELFKKYRNFQAVLMDIKLPVKDGKQAFREINSLDPDVPVIAQTAFALQHDEKELLALGFHDYISKPIKPDYLLEKLSKFIRA